MDLFRGNCAMSNQVKYKSYKPLSEALRRNEIRYSGVTATVFLDCFLSNNGELRASYVETKGLCQVGKFKIWRDEMIEKGWLVYKFGQYSRHYPGPKLIKYINKEKVFSSELASIPDDEKIVSKATEGLASTQDLDSRFAQVQAEVDQLKRVVKNMIEEFDPPVTDEKIQRRLKVVNEK